MKYTPLHPLQVQSHVFFAFTKSIPFTHKFSSFVVDHNVCLKKNASLEKQEHIAGPAIAETARQRIQINAIPRPHYFAFFKKLLVFTM